VHEYRCIANDKVQLWWQSGDLEFFRLRSRLCADDDEVVDGFKHIALETNETCDSARARSKSSSIDIGDDPTSPFQYSCSALESKDPSFDSWEVSCHDVSVPSKPDIVVRHSNFKLEVNERCDSTGWRFKQCFRSLISPVRGRRERSCQSSK